jgi:PAS domain S-box-containing protein/putative nucleotidyltransferase with HDIG domain
MHQGVLFMDSRGRITTVNPAAEIILGNEKEQLQGVQFKDLWENLRETNLPDSYEDLPPIIVQKTGRPAADLVCFLHQDSKRRQWVLMSSLPQFLEDSSSPSGIHTTITNITDLMNTSEALRHSEDQYRRLVESINDWIVEVDNDGTYTFVGPQVKDILGFSPQEVEGKHFTQFMPEDEAKRMSEIYLHHVEKQEPFNGIENVMLHRNGKLVIIETNGSPFFKDGELKGYRGINRDISYRREADELVQKANWELSRAYEATLEGWSDALILREQETAGHSQRVTSLTMKLARKVGVPEVEMPHIRRGALLHDIGKIGVPDSILKKEGQLLDEEWDVMRLHPVYAYQLLSPIKYLRPAMEIPYCHHEHWDGSGYPRGLKREGIPLSARIFSIVDVWDALTSSRPYSPAWSEDDAIRYIKEKSGTQFDPKLVEPFIELIAEINLSRQDTIPQKKDERIDQYLGE